MTTTTDRPPALAAGLLRRGHEIRRPGETDWLPVESITRTDVGVLLRAGGREFLTGPMTPWPARVPTSPAVQVNR